MSGLEETEQVWWFDSIGDTDRVDIDLHFDYGGETHLNNLGATDSALRQGPAFPDCLEDKKYLFTHQTKPLDQSKLFDLGAMNSTGIIVSGAMIDFLREGNFDLRDTDLLELPLYDGEEGFHMGRKPGDPVIPGRWGVLHVRARKQVLLPELSVADITEYTIDIRQKKTRLVVSEAALDGPDLWKDGGRNHLFMSKKLRDALVGSGLRIASIDWLRPAAVHRS